MNRNLCSIVWLALVCTLVHSEETIISDEAIEAALAKEPTCDGSSKAIQCGRTCEEYFTCTQNNSIPLSVNKCLTTAPFCNIGIKSDFCDTKRDTSRWECLPLPFLFQCTDLGYFPDPTDCTRYYICTKSTINPNRYIPLHRVCDIGLIYNANTRKCVSPTNTAICRTVSCKNGTSDFKVFPGYGQYFYNCVERSIRVDSGKTPVMYRCPGPSNVVFNSTTGDCAYACGSSSSSGRMMIPDKANEFFQCNYGSQAILERCPNGLRFIGSTCS